ncbi:LEAF RUST 10 DISEASE-RESISTANCE LOCUS RECEPTOR-LIKE PROTEIN KINASE-like 1.2 isoform X1 [Hevea brasiliensis]|uniref:LEAF RUST 10 DISEASE-RESISTANCE LOCUS RECEPTOR-LIKE PROTEIN KINASE-like 1.2 isoform X1 n=1 Tax=Hevea brasiliensis TaxID=3981 RepID=UPI002600BEA3|nr:LEAF RUST 10 DISEASE-RESISTANCE LOCUS RECEPTOR-LIKE PROTEIN KINASE-like 1.2 isoform X1 [Hevea brasiliensis]
MKTSSIQSFLLSFLIIAFLFSILSLPRYVYGNELYSNCAPFSCGNITDISYPFWGNNQPEYCGRPGFKIDCKEEVATLDILSLKYQVIAINPDTQILRIARLDLLTSICLRQYFNTTLNLTLFNYTSNDVVDATLFYNCELSPESLAFNEFSCPINNVPRDAYLMVPTVSRNEFLLGCNISIAIPILARAVQGLLRAELTVIQVLNQGFEVRWILDQVQCGDCLRSGGRCGYNWTVNQFSCFCPDQAYSRTCPSPMPSGSLLNPGETTSGDGMNVGMKVGIGVGSAFAGGAIMCLIFYIYIRRRKRKPNAPSSFVSRSITSDFASKSDIERGGLYFGVPVFTYAELEEATKNFDSAKELGDGGFGTVYYGKLRDGRAVAVKRLYENNYKRVEQFMNEVEILTRLRHPHLVSLYGCTSRHSRELLLVYEYIPNGTVADHLHGQRAKPGALPWKTRMKISVETANALAYLHASDIIHRDVKTNNILLDNTFCVKVADFGLSRLFPLDVTHVSTAPQGTPGYVDPEYHECYQLTDKSDVYSFGVVLIELISSMPAVDITRHRHEINLSNMAINKIQSDALHELVDRNLGFESDNATRIMITAVAELAFQCLQGAKEMRPSMENVLETLKEIQSKGYNIGKKIQEIDIQSDDVGLLKSCQLPRSPDTVMTQWTSSSTTSNNSS